MWAEIVVEGGLKEGLTTVWQFSTNAEVKIMSSFQNFDQLDPRARVFDYEGFDFHANCPNTQSWNRLSLLMDKIRVRMER